MSAASSSALEFNCDSHTSINHNDYPKDLRLVEADVEVDGREVVMRFITIPNPRLQTSFGQEGTTHLKVSSLVLVIVLPSPSALLRRLPKAAQTIAAALHSIFSTNFRRAVLTTTQRSRAHSLMGFR
ncbi:MAG: hypothetical protein ACI9R3_001053 [Verrucomicrobiales bacterium]|jgi:hypothetical protein